MNEYAPGVIVKKIDFCEPRNIDKILEFDDGFQ